MANTAHYTPAQVSAIAQSHGAPRWLGDALGATSVPESGGNPRVHNRSTNATGLLQVYPAAWPQLAAGGDLEDADYNIRSALYIVSQQGSSAWSGSGTWRGPAVSAGQFRFPNPAGTGGSTSPSGTSPVASIAGAALGAGGGLFDSFRGPAVKALLWVCLLAAGAFIALRGTSKLVGVGPGATAAATA